MSNTPSINYERWFTEEFRTICVQVGAADGSYEEYLAACKAVAKALLDFRPGVAISALSIVLASGLEIAAVVKAQAQAQANDSSSEPTIQ